MGPSYGEDEGVDFLADLGLEKVAVLGHLDEEVQEGLPPAALLVRVLVHQRPARRPALLDDLSKGAHTQDGLLRSRDCWGPGPRTR